MGTATTTIDKQINKYLARLNAKEKEAVLSLVKAFAESRQEYDWRRTDGASIAEMDRRLREMESGKDANSSVSKGRTIR